MPHRGVFLTTAVRAAILAVLLGTGPVSAQDDSTGTGDQAAQPPQNRINLMVTKPRGNVNEAQMQECEDRADAGSISGEIVVCRQIGENPDNLYSDRAEARKRYAEATANKTAPPTPDVFGIGDNGKGIGFGGAPPPALMIDVAALPKAPTGSDADRIARGLPPLGQDLELTEEQEKARREALGIRPAPEAVRLPSSSTKKKKR